MVASHGRITFESYAGLSRYISSMCIGLPAKRAAIDSRPATLPSRHARSHVHDFELKAFSLLHMTRSQSIGINIALGMRMK